MNQTEFASEIVSDSFIDKMIEEQLELDEQEWLQSRPKALRAERQTNTYSYDELVEVLDKHDLILKRKPKNKLITRNDRISFAKKDKPNYVYRAKLIDALTNNTSEFTRDEHFRLPNDDLQNRLSKRQESNERQRQKSEDKLRQSMFAEDCILTSRYETHLSPVHYEFNGYDYVVTPTRWNAGARPHQAKCVRYTHEHIKKLFADEGCELITEYKNQKQILTYKFNDKEYQVCFNDWLHNRIRKHTKSGRK